MSDIEIITPAGPADVESGNEGASGKGPSNSAATLTQLSEWALLPDVSILSCTRDANGCVVTANVTWPDGATGVLTTDTASTAFPGYIDAYHITYDFVQGNGQNDVTHIVTQPLVTRDSFGNVSVRPKIIIN
jgi:hypothetical protein